MCDGLDVSVPAALLLQAQSLENQNLETLYSPQDYSPQTEPLHQTTPLWAQPETEMRFQIPEDCRWYCLENGEQFQGLPQKCQPSVTN